MAECSLLILRPLSQDTNSGGGRGSLLFEVQRLVFIWTLSKFVFLNFINIGVKLQKHPCLLMCKIPRIHPQLSK